MQSIKKKLHECYLNKWFSLKKSITSIPDYSDIDHPHLLSTTGKFENEWKEAGLKIMLFGISTNGWGEDENIYLKDDSVAVNEVMKGYEKFYFDGGNWHYGQSFWNYYYALRELLQYKLGKPVSIIWNNVYKLSPEYYELEDLSFNVAKEEIKIFKPDVILVFGKDASDTLHNRMNGNNITWEEKKKYSIDSENKKRLLYYSTESTNYPELENDFKKLIITYHPNAHGGGGIRLKLMIDALKEELLNL